MQQSCVADGWQTKDPYEFVKKLVYHKIMDMMDKKELENNECTSEL